MKTRKTREWEILNKKLDSQLKNILPKDIWILIADYWPIFMSLKCPMSGKPLFSPNFVLHPHITPINYDRDSLIDSIREGELKALNLNEGDIIRVSEAKANARIFEPVNSETTALGKLAKVIFESNDLDVLERIPINHELINMPVSSTLNFKRELDLYISKEKESKKDTINLLNFLNQFNYHTFYKVNFKNEIEVIYDGIIIPTSAVGFLVGSAIVFLKGQKDFFPTMIDCVQSIPWVANKVFLIKHTIKCYMQGNPDLIRCRDKFQILHTISSSMGEISNIYVRLGYKLSGESIARMLAGIPAFIPSKIIGYDILKRQRKSGKAIMPMLSPHTLLFMSICLAYKTLYYYHFYAAYSKNNIPGIFLPSIIGGINDILCDLPTTLLLSHQMAEDIKQLIKAPGTFLTGTLDEKGCRDESEFRIKKTINRVLCSISFALITYATTENSALALLAFMTAFIDYPLAEKISGVNSWSPSLFHFPKRQSKVVIEEIDEPEEKQDFRI